MGTSADEGVVAGPGAAVRIGAPWAGYTKMSAADITDRLMVADDATVAAVKLYESANRRRKTVLARADECMAAGSSKG